MPPGTPAGKAASPSSRRAWIEIQPWGVNTGVAPVALLAEGVDRNEGRTDRKKHRQVALLAEGVDRNRPPSTHSTIASWVALLAEGVDRNWNCEPVN